MASTSVKPVTLRIELFDGKQFYSRELEFEYYDDVQTLDAEVQDVLYNMISDLAAKGMKAFTYVTRTEANV